MRLLTAGSLVRVQLEEPLYRGIAQLVEHRSPKPSAVGSIPTAPANAAIAQSVECILGKDEVTSSNLVSSSTKNRFEAVLFLKKSANEEKNRYEAAKLCFCCWTATIWGGVCGAERRHAVWPVSPLCSRATSSADWSAAGHRGVGQKRRLSIRSKRPRSTAKLTKRLLSAVCAAARRCARAASPSSSRCCIRRSARPDSSPRATS